MVPDFLVRVPVRRVFGKVEYVQPWLITNPSPRLFGSVWWRLVHYDYEMTSRMMPKHLVEKLDYLVRCDPLVDEAKRQLTVATDGGRGSYPSAFSRHLGLRSSAAQAPGFP